MYPWSWSNSRRTTMWLPAISRMFGGGGRPRTLVLNAPTHGPVALTSARAVTMSRRPRTSSTSVHRDPRSARTQRVRVRMTAPRAAASTALRTTSRASSTQQSEYSNPCW
jgi:hypothetical protein